MEHTHPLLFEPLYRCCSWGGRRLQDHYGRPGSGGASPVGESIEVAQDSIVANGHHAARPFAALIAEAPEIWIGRRHRSDAPFPIRCSFLDVGCRTALEVYPEDDPGMPPKTKFWYVIAAAPDACIRVGIRDGVTRHQFNRLTSPSAIAEALQTFAAEPGDGYLITAGRAHAVDEGTLLFSIAPDVDRSLCITDWGMETEHRLAEPLPQSPGAGAEAIHFKDRKRARIRHDNSTVQRNRKVPLAKHCPRFEVDEWRLVDEVQERTLGSCHVLMPIDGTVDAGRNGSVVRIPPGRCCLIPAAFPYYSIQPRDRTVRLLRIALRT